MGERRISTNVINKMNEDELRNYIMLLREKIDVLEQIIQEEEDHVMDLHSVIRGQQERCMMQRRLYALNLRMHARDEALLNEYEKPQISES